MLRTFLKDSVVYTVPSVISRGLAVFLVPLYTRVLSPGDFGSLDLLIVFAGIVNVTIALEVSQGVARFYAGEQDPKSKVAYASSAFWFTLACYSVFALLMLALADPLSSWILGQVGLETAFRIGIFYIWINGLFYLIQNQFRWELRSKEYAVTSMLMSFATAVSAVWLAYGLQWGLEGLLIAMAAGSLSGAVLGLWWLRGTFRLRFDVARLREMLAFSIPLVFSGVAVWISLYIDRLMINHFLTIDEVGLYGVGYRLASIAGLAMVGFKGALSPLVYTYYREADTPRQLARIFRFFLTYALMLFLGLSLFASEILRTMTTQAYYGAATIIVYLVPALLLANMYIFAPGIGIAKRTQYLIWINIGGALLNGALNYALIPILGIIGAALATMLNYLAVFVCYMVLSQRLYYVPHKWRAISAAVFIAGSIAALVPQWSLPDDFRWIVYVLALIVFFFLALGLGMVKSYEISLVWRLVANRIF